MIKCKHCCYFRSDIGECRFNPPEILDSMIASDVKTGNLYAIGIWPSVDPEDGCGFGVELYEPARLMTLDPEDEPTGEINLTEGDLA